MAEKVVVLSDLHSRKRKLVPLLQKMGAMDDRGKRNDGFHIIQLGDAVSLGYGMQEAGFYEWLTPWIDEWIVGNHEAPALFNYDDRFKFYGYEPGDFGTAGYDPKCRDLIIAAAARGRYQLAATVGDTLITHAGVHPRYQRNHDGWDTPTGAMAGLNEMWADHMHGYIAHRYHDCPVCDVSSHRGGCLWVRWDPLRFSDGHQFDQIVGHTPVGPVGTVAGGHALWNIDTPRLTDASAPRAQAETWGGVAALITEDEGETWEVRYEP